MILRRLPGLCYHLILQVSAFFGHIKAQSWLNAREQKLPEGPTDLLIHVASLGEYWMIAPLIKQWHLEGKRIVVSLFSPSGQGIQADCPCPVCYLPADRSSQLNPFLDQLQPQAMLFVKYDLWPVLCGLLLKRQIPYGLAFAHSPQGHWWLHPMNVINRPALIGLSFCSQQQPSGQAAWNHAGLPESVLTGDGRFDSVKERLRAWQPIEGIEEFIQGRKVLILGSSWPEDEALILPLIHRFPHIAFILAPHDVSRASSINHALPTTALMWSSWSTSSLQARQDAKLLLVDTMGDLFTFYGHANMAMIGGGFKQGLHNVLEAMVHGLPTCFGPETDGHWEADKAIQSGHANTVSNSDELKQWINDCLQKTSPAKQIKGFIDQHAGANTKVKHLVEDQLF